MATSRISKYWRKVGFTDNLAELSNLDENTILEELKSRYSRDVIYVGINMIQFILLYTELVLV